MILQLYILSSFIWSMFGLHVINSDDIYDRMKTAVDREWSDFYYSRIVPTYKDMGQSVVAPAGLRFGSKTQIKFVSPL